MTMDDRRPGPDEAEVIGTPTGEKMLARLGLTLEDLAGKTVVETASNADYLRLAAQQAGVDTEITGLNGNLLSLIENPEAKDIDIVLNIDGPLKGGPHEPETVTTYAKVLEVLSPHAELRIALPFHNGSGIGWEMYDADQEGYLPDTLDYLDQYPKPIKAEDGNGMPYEDDPFWIDFYTDTWSKKQKSDLNYNLATRLGQSLDQQGVRVKFMVGDSTPDDEKAYTPYLSLTKLPE